MSSFFNCYIKDSAKNISELLGKSKYYGDDKTIRNWYGTLNGIDFHVYDYKAYYNIEENEIYPYHIGTKSRKDSIEVVKMLKNAGLNAYAESMYLIN